MKKKKLTQFGRQLIKKRIRKSVLKTKNPGRKKTAQGIDQGNINEEDSPAEVS